MLSSTTQRIAACPPRSVKRSAAAWKSAMASASRRIRPGVERPAFRHPVEQVVLSDARHHDHPVLRLSPRADGYGSQEQAAFLAAQYGRHAEIERGRHAAVQPDLRLAGGGPFRTRAVVHVRETDGALELVDAVAGQKDHAAMGVDPLDTGTAMGGGIGQESRDVGLFGGSGVTCRHEPSLASRRRRVEPLIPVVRPVIPHVGFFHKSKGIGVDRPVGQPHRSRVAAQQYGAIPPPPRPPLRSQRQEQPTPCHGALLRTSPAKPP